MTSVADPISLTLRDPKLKERLQELRQTDNLTNFWYLVRTYLFFAVVFGATLWFFHEADNLGLSWWWHVPVAVVAIILIGAGQHQLTGLAHEASHHILFKNRL